MSGSMTTVRSPRAHGNPGLRSVYPRDRGDLLGTHGERHMHGRSSTLAGRRQAPAAQRSFSRLASAVAFTLLVSVGCGGGYRHRVGVDEDTEADRGGTGFSSQDLRTVAERMARSLITLPAVSAAKSPPRVAFLQVDNRSNQIIDTDVFLEKIRSLLLRHAGGRVRFLDRKKIKAIMAERGAKRAGIVTTGKSKNLGGADYFLTGSISSIDRVSGRARATYMRFSFRLTDAESSDIVWEDEYEMKKQAKRAIWD